MKCSMDLRNKLNLISELGEETKFQVLEYEALGGVKDLNATKAIKCIEEAGKRLKQIRIVLDDSEVKLQNDVLSYMKGYIERNDKIVEHKGIKKVFLDMANRQDIVKTTYIGSGEILLEPSYSDFVLIELIDEEIIIADELFMACDDEIEVLENNNEVILTGNGIVALKLPVAESEIIRCKLFNDRLVVNGDYVILKSAKIKSRKEKYQRNINGELVDEINNVYEGAGEVWLLPTKVVYEKYKDRFSNKNYEEYIEN